MTCTIVSHCPINTPPLCILFFIDIYIYSLGPEALLKPLINFKDCFKALRSGADNPSGLSLGAQVVIVGFSVKILKRGISLCLQERWTIQFIYGFPVVVRLCEH